MKRTLIISLLVAAMGVIAFVSCEKEDTIENPTTISAAQTTSNPSQTAQVTHNTTLSYSGCHSNQRDGYEPIVSTNYENGILLLTVEGFRVNCAMDSVSSELEIDNQTINLRIRETNPYSANCTCPIDIDYSIDKIKAGTYELIIKHYDWIVYQEEITCE
ncbi:MAG: hypothetical protein J6T63_05390 [Bacteroidales bacterium]|nr:hypothetical protein [Bacteroidales bacterium]